jgi:hypothetical protein
MNHKKKRARAFQAERARVCAQRAQQMKQCYANQAEKTRVPQDVMLVYPRRFGRTEAMLDIARGQRSAVAHTRREYVRTLDVLEHIFPKVLHDLIGEYAEIHPEEPLFSHVTTDEAEGKTTWHCSY